MPRRTYPGRRAVTMIDINYQNKTKKQCRMRDKKKGNVAAQVAVILKQEMR